MELVFPLDKNNLTDLTMALSNYFALQNFNITGGITVVEAYMGKASKFWMSPMYGSDCLRLGIFSWWGC
jgi:hypothetical protein